MRKIIFILPLLFLGFVLQSCGQTETATTTETKAENRLQNLSEADKEKLIQKAEKANKYFGVDKLIEAYESKGLTLSDTQKIQIDYIALVQFVQAKKELAEVSETASEIPQEKRTEIRKANRKILTQKISKNVMTPDQRKIFKAQSAKKEEPQKG